MGFKDELHKQLLSLGFRHSSGEDRDTYKSKDKGKIIIYNSGEVSMFNVSLEVLESAQSKEELE